MGWGDMRWGGGGGERRRKCRGGIEGGCCREVGSVGWKRQRRARVEEVGSWRGRRGGSEGEEDPRTENKDGNEKQDGIKMPGKKQHIFSLYHIQAF